MTSTPLQYPFTAIVGQGRLRLALTLALIDPGVGGVLIEGPRGMAKTTMARGVAEFITDGELVSLPLGAGEDRVIGSLDLEKALGDSKVQFRPGLLAKAHGGVLYVDEVNLLADHLVDVLLDVAASGVNHVERDGVSHNHSARFVLIGTMNPEEGELRPQLLDRFGFIVSLDQALTLEQRKTITQRRLSFDMDPAAFVAEYQTTQTEFSSAIAQAQSLLPSIALDEVSVDAVAERCHEAQVDGLRADLVMLRAARAHAAWSGQTQIRPEDIEAVAELALAHRRKTPPPPQTSESPQTPSSSMPESQSQEGDWGDLPPQAVGMDEVQLNPAWQRPPEKK